MKHILLFALLALFAAFAPGAAASYSPESNLIANPGYEDGFAAWDIVENWTLTDTSPYGAHAASATVVQGAPALLCSKPYPAQGAPLSLRVSFKARGAATATGPGRGIGLFMVRWLGKNGEPLGDTVLQSTDNARRGWQRVGWTNPYFDEDETDGIVRAQFQVCARAYAYRDKPFKLVIDEWSAGE